MRFSTPAPRRIFWSFVGLILGTVITIIREGGFDFAQDYASAWAWWHGMKPSSSTAAIFAACCPENYITGALQNAHPPFSTLMILPFGLLPFPIVRGVWLILSAVMIVAAWEVAAIPYVTRIATASMWIFGLSLGAFEPLVFLLVALALVSQERAPFRTAVLIGLAAAIKVYPGILMLGFLATRRWREFFVALLTGTLGTVAAHAILGGNALRAWLDYTPVNMSRYMYGIGNPSPVRYLSQLVPSIAPSVFSAIVLMICAVAAWRTMTSTRRIDALIPAMLLSSPLIGSHYIASISLIPIGTWATRFLAIAGVLVLGTRLGIVPDTVFFVTAPMFLLALLLGTLHYLRKTTNEQQINHTA